MFVRILKILFAILTIILLVLPYLNPIIAGYFIFECYLAIIIFIFDVLLVFIPYRKSHFHHSHHHKHRRKYWQYIYILIPLICLYVIFPVSSIYNLFSSPERNSQSLIVVSWNTDNYRLKKSGFVESSEYIRKLHPDIICLQERPNSNLLNWSSFHSQFPEYKYSVKNSREDEVLNLAIFSKYPINGYREYYYPHSYNKTMRVDVKIGSKTIRLFNAHLQTTGIEHGNTDTHNNLISRVCINAVERNRQVDQLIDAIDRSPYPVVLCGDLNDVYTGYPYRRLVTRLNDIDSSFFPHSSYQMFGLCIKIDYILVSKQLKSGNYQLIGNQWSDHKIQVGRIFFN